MKTTRILAEMDDETSGTESYYMSDAVLSDGAAVMSDYEWSETECRLGRTDPLLAACPLLTEAVVNDVKTHSDDPTATGIVLVLCMSVILS